MRRVADTRGVEGAAEITKTPRWKWRKLKKKAGDGGGGCEVAGRRRRDAKLEVGWKCEVGSRGEGSISIGREFINVYCQSVDESVLILYTGVRKLTPNDGEEEESAGRSAGQAGEEGRRMRRDQGGSEAQENRRRAQRGSGGRGCRWKRWYRPSGPKRWHAEGEEGRQGRCGWLDNIGSEAEVADDAGRGEEETDLGVGDVEDLRLVGRGNARQGSRRTGSARVGVAYQLPKRAEIRTDTEQRDEQREGMDSTGGGSDGITRGTRVPARRRAKVRRGNGWGLRRRCGAAGKHKEEFPKRQGENEGVVDAGAGCREAKIEGPLFFVARAEWLALGEEPKGAAMSICSVSGETQYQHVASTASRLEEIRARCARERFVLKMRHLRRFSGSESRPSMRGVSAQFGIQSELRATKAWNGGGSRASCGGG
ncbi:hypothetical protein C8F04DRAFT_1345742 [Mycena alexandri]|uniref:Uncharacterized protein n=1 Tax=Mycena alexandri TaxID=1745969 RepID=A0AAD6SXD5_9AGAR|nr:hypothetical protein C8F04DRAFT_1345742 [Mycena alexandri]